MGFALKGVKDSREELMKRMNMIILVVFIITAFFFQAAMAADSAELASTHSTCEHSDGDGSYYGAAGSKHEARSQATSQCVMIKIDNFEARYGQMPDEDTVDLYMDACVNICK